MVSISLSISVRKSKIFYESVKLGIENKQQIDKREN